MHMGHAAFMPPLINARCEALSPPERLFDSVTKNLSAWGDIHFSSPVSLSSHLDVWQYNELVGAGGLTASMHARASHHQIQDAHAPKQPWFEVVQYNGAKPNYYTVLL